MEIPELGIDEIRKIFREMWIGSMMGSEIVDAGRLLMR